MKLLWFMQENFKELISEFFILSEKSLSKIWSNKDEDEAWKDL